MSPMTTDAKQFFFGTFGSLLASAPGTSIYRDQFKGVSILMICNFTRLYKGCCKGDYEESSISTLISRLGSWDIWHTPRVANCRRLGLVPETLNPTP